MAGRSRDDLRATPSQRPEEKRGGYPAGDKPPSQLKPPPSSLTTKPEQK